MSKRSSPYERELDQILDSLPGMSGQSGGLAEPLGQDGTGNDGKQSPKPTLLLHACCAPCSSYVIEYLAGYFAITLFYYNPNIHPATEYDRRLQELKDFLPRFPAAKGISLIEGAYEPEDFFRATGVREEPDLRQEAEKGERCRRCYELRLRAAYRAACEGGFDWFTTTLSISPFKDAGKINAIGKALEQEGRQGGDTLVPGGSHGKGGHAENGLVRDNHTGDDHGKDSLPRFLPSDFKKKGGFKRSLELSAEYGLYRQDYCGCVCSLENSRARPGCLLPASGHTTPQVLK